MKLPFLILFSFLFLSTIHCGGSGTEAVEEPPDESETINTAKLIGTPFEGKETGDDFDWEFFLCNQYRTETIDSLPIQIFAAYFTQAEEDIIREGIEIANEAMGPTEENGVFYELTDTWSDEVRIIYKVNGIINEETGIDYDAAGQTQSVEARFNNKTYAETQKSDWRIELVDNSGGINKWTIAHELGHASGITGHYLIDYENDIFTRLEEDSLMASDGGGIYGEPILNNYNYMMQQQGQIISNHFQELGALGGETCIN